MAHSTAEQEPAAPSSPPKLNLVPDEAPTTDTAAQAWLEELGRLVAEAQERLQEGRVLPALSSLAALPPLHRLLIGHCSGLLEATDTVEPDPGELPGLYL